MKKNMESDMEDEIVIHSRGVLTKNMGIISPFGADDRGASLACGRSKRHPSFEKAQRRNKLRVDKAGTT